MNETKLYDVAIIGAGVGGYVCAIRASQLGLKVVLIEKMKNLGGTCLNVGCIPSKILLESTELYYEALHEFKEHGIFFEKISFNLDTLLERKEKIVKQLTEGITLLMKYNKVKVVHGVAKLLSNNLVKVNNLEEGKEETFSAKNIVLATGSVPISLPFLPFDKEIVVSSEEALSFKEIPKSLIVIGGGAIGLELGSVWSRLGSKVTIIEIMSEILPGVDTQLSKHLNRLLKKQGIEIYTDTKVVSFDKIDNKGKIKAVDKKGKEIEFIGDKILVSVGRRPFYDELGIEELGIKIDEKTKKILVDEKFRTNISNIFAVGDIIAGPMLAHKAEEEGIAVAEIIKGEEGHVNYETIPSVVYTLPEVASVGKSEEQLKNEGKNYKVGIFNFRVNGRALSKLATDGFVKILADEVTDQILGVHMLGKGVSELISEGVTVMEFGGSSEDIARTIHAHPTMSEVIKEAALAVDKRAIHEIQRKI